MHQITKPSMCYKEKEVCREDTTIFLSLSPKLSFRYLNFCYVPGTRLDSRLMWQMSNSLCSYFFHHSWVVSFINLPDCCIYTAHVAYLYLLWLYFLSVSVILVLVVLDMVCMCVFCGTIFLCTVKIYCCHGFNKELNGQQVGRKRLGRTCR